MQLRRVEISGFKTFAERTRVVLRSGVTMVVGPNGSGKSNIIDAIRWAMGEQSSRSLRVRAPAELIFNGAGARTEMPMAEVSVVFDNKDGGVALDAAEVTVTRRLYRSQEQEYLLNGASCRLREVRELFGGSGIGGQFYSILEQGRADALLSGKMEERRAVFEEIAGIRGYRRRYAEAERRLSDSVGKMQQIEPLLEEIRGQHAKLKRQCAVVDRYRALKGRLQEAQMRRDAGHFYALSTQLATLAERLRGRRAARAEKQEGYEALVEQGRERQGEINALREQIIAARDELHNNQLAQERERHAIRSGEQEQQNIEERIGHEQRLLERDQNRIEALRAEGHEEQALLLKARREGEQVSGQLEELQKAIKNHHARTTAQQRTVSDLQARIKEDERRREELWIRIRELSSTVVETLEQIMHPQGGDASSAMGRVADEVAQVLDRIGSRLTQQAHHWGDKVVTELADREALRKLITEYQNMVERVRDEHHHLSEAVRRYRGLVDPLVELLTDPSGDFAQRHILDQEYQLLGQQVERLRREIEGVQREMTATRATIEQSRDQEARLRVLQERCANRVALHEKNGARITTEINTLTASRNTVHDRISAYRGAKDNLKKRDTSLQSNLKRLQQTNEKLGGGLATQQRALTALETAVVRVQERAQVKRRALAESDARLEKAAEVHARAEARVDEAKRHFQEQYDDDLVRYAERYRKENGGGEVPRTGGAQQIAQFKEKIASLGRINMMAPVEFEEIDARYTLLSEQLDDLRRARADLKRVTSHIIEQSGVQLSATIKGVNSHFGAVFRDLFGGGSAKLYLEEPENPLDSAIRIEAYPPGKKPVRIEQLSGGERSLSGLSLLFAFFRYRPSPVALMDEVDATLDENNVTGFAEHLASYREQTQFIIISHNPRAIAYAETLIGVTMQEEGVSTVVEVDATQYR